MEPAWIFFTIGIALILAKIGDSIIERFELPSVLGELLMGMILGNIVYFGLVSSQYLPITVNTSEVMDFLAKLGIIFLLFLGALDTDISMLKKTGVTATISTVLGVFVPLILGWFGTHEDGISKQGGICWRSSANRHKHRANRQGHDESWGPEE